MSTKYVLGISNLLKFGPATLDLTHHEDGDSVTVKLMDLAAKSGGTINDSLVIFKEQWPFIYNANGQPKPILEDHFYCFTDSGTLFLNSLHKTGNSLRKVLNGHEISNEEINYNPENIPNSMYTILTGREMVDHLYKVNYHPKYEMDISSYGNWDDGTL